MSSRKFSGGGMAVADHLNGNGHIHADHHNKSKPHLHQKNGHKNGDSAEIKKPLSQKGNVKNLYTFEYLQESVEYIQSRTTLRPKIAIICGSGLGPLAECLDESVDFPYEEIPHFPTSTVPGHAGKLVIGKMGDVPVVCMQGRFHYYEGYPLWKCAMPVRIFKLLGVEMMVVTNAAGGINQNYKVGDIMILKDHVNFPGMGGESVLRGPNDDRFGPRFIAMNKAYDTGLRKLAKQISSELEMSDFFHEGVYTMVGGPSFETVTELRLMKLLGVDAVGMSTVPEVIAARHCGIKCFGFSLITNECIMEYDHEDEANHEEVMVNANKRTPDLIRFTVAFITAASQQLGLDK